jgi:hypothetical protein
MNKYKLTLINKKNPDLKRCMLADFENLDHLDKFIGNVSNIENGEWYVYDFELVQEKQDNAVPPLDQSGVETAKEHPDNSIRTYTLVASGSNPTEKTGYITIECDQTKEKKTFNQDTIQYKLQHNFYNKRLDNDKYKFLFNLKS